MKRVPIVILCLAIAVIILISVSAMAWHLWKRPDRAIYTDGDKIHLSQGEAIPRTVLWQPPEPLPSPINSSEHEYEPRLSADGTMMYFVRGKAGGNADIYFATRTMEGAWSEPHPLVEINTADDELGPEISRDGLLFVFHSNRPGGLGGYDLWVSHNVEGRWQPPVNLGPAVNTPHNEYGAAITPSGDRLYFSSNRPAGESNSVPTSDAWSATLREQRSQHHYDLYLSLFVNDESQPAALLFELNSEFNEGAPAFSPAGDFLYFCSDRPGGHGGYDLYRSRLLQGDHLPPTNIGLEVNTAADDMDPALGMGGFELVFSTNRRNDAIKEVGEDDSLQQKFDLYATVSREVFLKDEPSKPLIDWASLWSMIAPTLLWLLLALLSLLALLALIKGVKSRKLSLVARCLLASLIAHLVLMLMLTFWQVTVTIAEAIERGGTQIALTSHATGDELAQQVRGGLTDVAIELTTPNTARAEIALPRIEELEGVDPPAISMAATAPDALNIEPAVHESSMPVFVSLVSSRPEAIDPHVVRHEPSIPTEAVTSTESEPQAASFTPSAVSAASERQPTDIRSTAIETQSPTAPPQMTQPMIASHAITVPHISEAAPSSTEPNLKPITVIATAATELKTEIHLPSDQSSPEAQAIEVPAAMPISANAAPSARVEPRITETQIAAFDSAPVAPQTTSTSTTRTTESLVPAAASLVNESTAAPTSQAAPPQITLALDASLPPLPVTALAIPTDRETSSSASDKPEAAAAMPLIASAASNHSASASTGRVSTNIAQPQIKSASAPSSDFIPSAADTIHTNPINPASFDHLPSTSSSASLPSPSSNLAAALSTAAIPITPGDSSLADIAIPRDLAPPAPPTPPSPPAEQFTQRAEDTRRDLVEQMGGSEATENAVKLALKWLAAHQSEDGRWAARDFDDNCGDCRGRAKFDTDIAATGLALLCFMGANHTHQNQTEYHAVVTRGLNWLIAQQKLDGDLRTGETMYSHGIAAIAIAEAYGMTRDPKLLPHVESAIAFICDPRNQRAGGWRYEPGQPGDTSVLGWQIMALHSAKSAGVNVPDEPFAIAARWLNTVSNETRPGLYAYQPGQRHTPSMTAEGMFVQQLLGVAPDQPRMQTSADYITRNPPRWQTDAATYYWYYATLAMFQHQGETWEQWNAALTDQLLAHQRTTGTAAGSWDPQDNWSKIGGRIYQTALCTLCLEVYYRYLPMYGANRQAGSTP